jgi:hypothetical protein
MINKGRRNGTGAEKKEWRFVLESERGWLLGV